MPTSPGPMLTALESLWERLRDEVSELPPIRPTISPTTRKQGHGPQRWTKDDDGVVTGLVVTADVMREGPEAVLEHVLHEAAHLLNWTRGVSDTTMRGAYHNQTFLTAAEEVGLEWPEGATRVQGKGYVNPVLSTETRRRYRRDLVALDAAIEAVLPHMVLPASGSHVERTPARLTLKCQCEPPRTFRISRTVAAAGPIICGVCTRPFIED
ncbi:hypothetical protein ACF1DV_25835 [Streptomyces achromogenes]|uniref:hypothetical protein n=1 Tax=Streptomyces achromogenes TaxID=67255 RepID=UPI0036FBC80B